MNVNRFSKIRSKFDPPGRASRILKIVFISLLAAFLLYTSFIRHSGNRIQEWEKEIYSDKSGYYIYLPAVFIYGFDAKKFPDHIEQKSGFGFSFVNNKVRTKYPYGVSLLMAPFFLMAHAIAHIFKSNPDGFSVIYQKMINVAAVFYLLLGFIFLFRFLRFYFKESVIYISLLFLLFGTNLLYYATDDTGMSHVYSFAVFSVLLYFFKRFTVETDDKKKLRQFIVISCSVAVIFVIRNINVLFLPFIFLWDLNGLSSLKNRFKSFFKLKYILVLILILTVILLPQLIYWKYISGSFFSNGYENESFTFWKHPKVLHLWFAPRNGIFLYNPLVLLLAVFALVMLFYKKFNGALILLLFAVYTYIYASWFCWFLGSGFGSRAMVDIYPLLIFPLPFILVHLRKNIGKILVCLLLLVFSLYSLNLFFSFKKAFFGLSDWDWYEYNTLVFDGDIFSGILGKNFYQETPVCMVTMKAYNGIYVYTLEDRSLVADKNTSKEPEQFKMFRIDEHRIAFKSVNNKYACDNMSQDNYIMAISRKRAVWEYFTLFPLTDHCYAFKACNNKFIKIDTASGNRLWAEGDSIGPFEKFKLDTIAGDP